MSPHWPDRSAILAEPRNAAAQRVRPPGKVTTGRHATPQRRYLAARCLLADVHEAQGTSGLAAALRNMVAEARPSYLLKSLLLQRDMARLGFVVSQIREIEEARQK